MTRDAVPSRPRRDAATDQDWSARVQRLEAEVAGLHRAMRTRGLIEQAKGVLAERLGCDPEEAFGHLSRLSQNANVPVVDIAADVVGAPRPQSEGPVAALTVEPSRRLRRTLAAVSAAAGMGEFADALRNDGLAHLDVAAVAILLNAPGGSLRPVAASGWPAQMLGELPVEFKAVAAQVAQTGQPLLITGDEQFDGPAAGLGAACALFPTRTVDEVVGVVLVTWPAPRQLSDEDRQYLEALLGAVVPVLRRLPQPVVNAAGDDLPMLSTALDAMYGPGQVLSPVRDATNAVVDFVIEYASVDVPDTLGHSRAQMSGRRLLDLYPYLVSNGVFDAYVQVLTDGVPYERRASHEHIVFNGRPRQITVSRRAARVGDKLVISWRRLDRELRREEHVARMEALGRIGFAEWDLDADEVYWSPGLFRVLEWDASRAPAALDRFVNIAVPDDLSVLQDVVERLLQQKKEVVAEIRVHREHGELARLRISAEPTVDRRGRVMLVRAVVRDVTEERLVEERLRRTETQLGEQRVRLATEKKLTRQMRQLWHPSEHLSATTRGAQVTGRHWSSASERHFRGDLLDATVAPNGDLLIAVGDIFGSGLSAAATMTRLLHPSRVMGLAGVSPAEILMALNGELHRDEEISMASLVLGRYLVDESVLIWAQAGHLAPVLVRGAGARQLPRPDGPLLGLKPDVNFGQARLPLQADDLLLLFTDGVVPRRLAPDADADPMPLMLNRWKSAARRGGVPAVLEQSFRPDEDDACMLILAALPNDNPTAHSSTQN